MCYNDKLMSCEGRAWEWGYVQIAVEVNLYNDVHSCIDMINQEGFMISQTEVIGLKLSVNHNVVHCKSMYMYLYLSDTTSKDICFHAATACNVIPLNMVL